jgi:CHAD domain-containing protein
MATGAAQYLLPEGLGVAAASDALAARLEVNRGRPRSCKRTLYDTFDGRLHAAGLVLVHEDGRLALVDSLVYAERAGIDQPAPPERVLVDDLPAGRLRNLLLPMVDVRALIPIAQINSRLRPLRVLNKHAKTVVRIVVEEAAVVASGRPRVPLRPRLLVAPVRGYGKATARLRRALEGDLGLRAAAEPLHDEAVTAAGGRPGGAISKLEFALRPEQRADSAAAQVLARLLQVIEANLPGTLADVDSEFLHDLRVAVRRSRSVQRQLAGVFPPEPLERFRAELRWLQQVTGPSRDLDVYALEFDRLRSVLPEALAGDLEPVRRLLAERRREEQASMASTLQGSRATALLADWSRFLDGLVDSPQGERPDAGRQIGDVAGERIRAVYGRMVKMGRAIDDSSPPEALHKLRKKGKELRYLLELFGDLYPDEVVKPMLKTLKSLQNTLGRFQDREVQAQMLRSLRDEVVDRDDGAAALMAMGLLVDRLEREQAAARSEFAERFAAFRPKRQRALVARTFG